MSNPFEDESAQYFALENDEGQHSLWPSWIDIPAGWHQKHGPAPRQECLKYVEQHWTDMRPKSLIATMEAKPD